MMMIINSIIMFSLLKSILIKQLMTTYVVVMKYTLFVKLAKKNYSFHSVFHSFIKFLHWGKNQENHEEKIKKNRYDFPLTKTTYVMGVIYFNPRKNFLKKIFFQISTIPGYLSTLREEEKHDITSSYDIDFCCCCCYSSFFFVCFTSFKYLIW